MKKKEQEVETKVRGIVKWFSDQKGFGFIRVKGGTEDVFVHYTHILDNDKGRKTLYEDDEVEFVIENSAKTGKSCATNVTRVVRP
jgi:CspA family cold shock protein